ncbi:uncharacterized protein LOC133224407 [Neopsephotus bourkii]|uniref:uncharacterized protein LOC133224407 n=1 Tax=Neopsephotus bourkii TaxID=309878 RepID=UPI002AA5026B|nr:uncharacterized protein LOC133224407 [Neopsephotus bourkii]
MKRKSRRRKAPCPAALPEENEPSCAPPQCKRQQDGPGEEGECTASRWDPARGDCGRKHHRKVVASLPHPAPSITLGPRHSAGGDAAAPPAVCGFCRRADCNPEVVGQLCRQGGFCVHENCLYHASRLQQRGADEEGFYGFLFPDIKEELKRVAQKVGPEGITVCIPYVQHCTGQQSPRDALAAGCKQPPRCPLIQKVLFSGNWDWERQSGFISGPVSLERGGVVLDEGKQESPGAWLQRRAIVEFHDRDSS